MVASPLRLIPQSHGGPARPAVFDPGATPADTRVCTIAVPLSLCPRQIGIDAPEQLTVVPVAAPLPLISVHIVESPGIGRIAANPRRTPGGISRTNSFGECADQRELLRPLPPGTRLRRGAPGGIPVARVRRLAPDYGGACGHAEAEDERIRGEASALESAGGGTPARVNNVRGAAGIYATTL